MKKKLKITLIITIIILLTILDLCSIKFRNKPILTFDSDSCFCLDKTYRGLFYDTYYCFSEDTTYIKPKWNKFSCRIDKVEVINIIDTSLDIKDFACAEALEEIYRDTTNIYYLPCIKSEYIIVNYNNGYQKNIKEALKFGDITINELNKYNINYYAYPTE